LANGQPTGIEGAGTTETGSYALNGAITDADLMAVTRNFSAKYVIPTLNEWYKAAYYKGGSTDAGYWLYPTQSNATPSYVLSSSGTNNANYGTGYPTWVGAYVSSPGPYGTYDMGGDVYQWTDQLGQKQDGTVMGFILEGGSCDAGSVGLQSGYAAGGYPTCEYFYYGFRVAEVPEPVTMAILALGGFGMLTRRRGR
jgi:formylglycine-generating enzyme required for sulfatase activity